MTEKPDSDKQLKLLKKQLEADAPYILLDEPATPEEAEEEAERVRRRFEAVRRRRRYIYYAGSGSGSGAGAGFPYTLPYHLS